MLKRWDTTIFDLMTICLADEIKAKGFNFVLSIIVGKATDNGKFQFQMENTLQTDSLENAVQITAFRWSQKDHYDRLITYKEVV
jgi:hypothetical protein